MKGEVEAKGTVKSLSWGLKENGFLVQMYEYSSAVEGGMAARTRISLGSTRRPLSLLSLTCICSHQTLFSQLLGCMVLQGVFDVI